jgi:hypothetical protein
MASWVNCPCGTEIGTGSFPNPNVYRVVSEEAYDKIEDPVDRKRLAVFFLSGGTLVRCPKCRGVLIQWTSGTSFEFFGPELQEAKASD